MHYPPQIEIQPLTKPPCAKLRPPGSKSITNRALILAALTRRYPKVALRGALHSEDTQVMIDSLRRLGFEITVPQPLDIIVQKPNGARIVPAETADLFVANSGTSMRFLTALVALGDGRYRLDGVPRMRERPIRDLLDGLTQLGVDAVSEAGNGCPPVLVNAHGLDGGVIRMKGDVSSQFLSGLLMAAPFARTDVTIEIDGPLVSVPYVTMTTTMMRHFGFAVEQEGQRFHVPAPQQLDGTPGIGFDYDIEIDASAASYFFGAAAITGGSISVEGIHPPHQGGLQGDFRFVDVLEQMGCQVDRFKDPSTITVHGRPLHGVDVDMNDISDTVMTLAVVACFAEGPTTIRNVGHIRHKETDRLTALATELRRIGASVEERPDGLTIHPAPLHGAVVQTYDDHRMAMSFALVGSKIPKIVIDHPGCVAKTYPGFFLAFQNI